MADKIEHRVLSLRKEVGAAADSGKATNVTRDALDSLLAMEIPLKVLLSTKIGVPVAKLRKVDNAAVADLAKALVKKWKDLVPVSPPASESKPAVKVIVKTPTPSAAQSLHKKRATVRNMLVSSFKAGSEALETLKTFDFAGKAEEVETGLYTKHWGDGVEPSKRYFDHFQAIHHGLSVNPNLLLDICTGALDIDALTNMSQYDVITEETKREMEETKRKAIEAQQTDWAERHREELDKAVGIAGKVGQFKCPSCHSRNTVYSQKQTRSSDEPMTTFVFCQDCAHRWRFC